MAKIEIKGKGPTIHDLDIKIDGHEISMLKGIKLSFACDEYNYAEIGFLVDEVDIDAEALAVLQAEYVKKFAEMTEEVSKDLKELEIKHKMKQLEKLHREIFGGDDNA